MSVYLATISLPSGSVFTNTFILFAIGVCANMLELGINNKARVKIFICLFVAIII